MATHYSTEEKTTVGISLTGTLHNGNNDDLPVSSYDTLIVFTKNLR